MPEPDPIWGLHLAPGAIAGALVARAGDGFEVRETFVVPAPADAAGLTAAAADAARRPGVAGRASLTAVADHRLAVATGCIPTDELYLNDEEIYHHLHDFAPFEPGEGQIVYRPVGRREQRKFLVVAIPESAQDSLEELATVLDERWHGLALSTPSLVRGARALGLIGDRTFLVELQASQTVVVAVDGEDERRYLIASGLERCGSSMDAAEQLAGDVLRVLAYHAEVARRETPGEGAHPTGDVVLVGPHAQRARALLDRALGERLAPASRRAGKPERISDAAGAPLADGVVHEHAAAIGAALEAFERPEDRLVLRHPPADVPEYRGPPPAAPGRGGSRLPAIAAGGLVIAALAAGGWMLLGRGEKTVVDERRAESLPPETPGNTAHETAAADPTDPPGDDAEAADARAALGDLALRVAHARAIMAACAALAAADPPLTARSYTTEEVLGTLRVTLLADVAGDVTPDLRRAARSAVEAVPGVEEVAIDVQDGALRVRCRSAIAPRPEPGPGPRIELYGLARVPESAPPAWEVPVDDGGRPLLGRELLPALFRKPPAGTPGVRLTSAESAFAAARIAEAIALAAAWRAAGADALQAAPGGDGGAVTLRLSPAPEAALPVLRRRLPDGAWEAAGELAAHAGTFVDHVPGAGGRYAWRCGDGEDAPTAEADVAIPVAIDLAGVDAEGRVPRFRLERRWRGQPLTAELEAAAPGCALRAERDGVVLDSGLTFEGVEPGSVTETVTEQVPEFLPDGKLRRDDEGHPVLAERTHEREIRTLEVRARDASGKVRTWLRKMTDG